MSRAFGAAHKFKLATIEIGKPDRKPIAVHHFYSDDSFGIAGIVLMTDRGYVVDPRRPTNTFGAIDRPIA